MSRDELMDKLFNLLDGRKVAVVQVETDGDKNDECENCQTKKILERYPYYANSEMAEAAVKKLLALKPGDPVRFYNNKTNKIQDAWIEHIQQDRNGFTDAYCLYLDDDGVLKAANMALHGLHLN